MEEIAKVWVLSWNKRDYGGYEYVGILGVYSSPEKAFKTNPKGYWQKVNDNFYKLVIESGRQHLELYGYVLDEE